MESSLKGICKRSKLCFFLPFPWGRGSPPPKQAKRGVQENLGFREILARGDKLSFHR